jgi:hypothetical protein
MIDMMLPVTCQNQNRPELPDHGSRQFSIICTGSNMKIELASYICGCKGSWQREVPESECQSWCWQCHRVDNTVFEFDVHRWHAL